MARRRMFSLDICDTDQFLDMPCSAQNLYFHLGMRADDDGFIASPRKIINMTGCSTDDFDLLVSKNYIIPFKSGVCAVKDWKINNYVRLDRYTPTRYITEKQQLETLNIGDGIPDDIPDDIPAVSTGKVSIGEDRLELGKVSLELGKGREQARERFTPPTVDEVAAYCQERGNAIDPKYFVDFYDAKGWHIGKNPMEDWRAAVRTWEHRDNSSSVQNKPMATADRLAQMIQEGTFDD